MEDAILMMIDGEEVVIVLPGNNKMRCLDCGEEIEVYFETFDDFAAYVFAGENNVCPKCHGHRLRPAGQ